MKYLVLTLSFLLGCVAALPRDTVAQKVTAEDIIAKHVASIGSADDRAKMLNLTAVGEVIFAKSTNSKEEYKGKVVFATEANKVLFAMTFPSPVYQGEKMSFDGKNAKIGFAQAAQRSLLGNYLFQYDMIMRQGLMSGVLSKGWSLFDPDSHNVKITLDGIKKIDGKEVYALNYEPKKGSDIRVKIYFDKETYRHVRTEYKRTNMAGASNNPSTSSRLSDTHEDMTEDFSDFKTEYGVTLPRTYKIHVFVERSNSNFETYYTCRFTDLYYNSKFEPNTFDIDAK